MAKLAILADSTCDLPESVIAENKIRIIPLKVVFGEETYQDGVDIDTPTLYQKVEQLKDLPKTAAVGIAEFTTIFEEVLQTHDQLLFISIGSDLSSTYQNAVLAGEDFSGRVFVHDSKSLSSGIGLQVLKAVRMRDAGKDITEIMDYLTNVTPHVHASFAIEKMDYLHKGGRCNGLMYIVGNLLRVKPIILVKEGKMIVAAKRYGNFTKALDYLIENALGESEIMDGDTAFITHSLGEQWAEYIHERIKEHLPVKEILISNAGCVISSHCGRGTIGILYIKKH